MGNVIPAQFGPAHLGPTQVESGPVSLVETEDGLFMAVEAFCRNHHIDVARQLHRLQNEKVYREGVKLMPLGPNRIITPLLRCELMHGFLMGVPDADAADPAALAKLQAFKERGHQLLWAALGAHPYADPFHDASRTGPWTSAGHRL